MTRLGEKLRASAVGLLAARTAEAERQRDDARGVADRLWTMLDRRGVYLAPGQDMVARVDGLLDHEANASESLARRCDELQQAIRSTEAAFASETTRLHGDAQTQRDRADRAEDLVSEVGAWVASITGEHPAPEVRIVDAVRRAAVVYAATLREERDHAREAADAWRPGTVPARAGRLIEEERWVHAVAAHDRSHVMFSGRARGYTDRPTFVIELSDGTRRSWVADLVVDAHDQQPRTAESEEIRDETTRRLAREIFATRAVLAPDESTAGTPLAEVATAALATARATAVAAELRWWVAPGNAPGQDYVGRLLLEKRAEQLDPSGVAPDGPEPPTPTIFRADDEPPVPRRVAAGLATNLAAAARRTAQQRDAKAGHPDEVLVALRVADKIGPAQPGLGGVLKERGDALRILARAVRAYSEDPDDVVDATIGCGELLSGRVCSLPEHHEGEHVPSWTVLDDEQVAREAMHAAITAPPQGWASGAAADVVDRLTRAGFVPGVYPPGMAIDGDMLRSLITDALPRWATDEFAGELADSVLDAAVRAGFTILHGTNLTPRRVTLAVRACRGCGCTDDRACVDDGLPCAWAEADLCSRCEAKEANR